MHDQTGKPLQVGDSVLIPAVITAIHPGENDCNGTFEIDKGPGQSYAPSIAMNTKNVFRNLNKDFTIHEAPREGDPDFVSVPSGKPGRDENAGVIEGRSQAVGHPINPNDPPRILPDTDTKGEAAPGAPHASPAQPEAAPVARGEGEGE